MRGTNRKYVICFESLEKALAENPETYGHLDLLCGGWPCQDNSIANTRSRKGHDGEKSGLWKELKRLIGLFRPKWFVGENVPGLFSVNGGRDFWQVVSDLDSFGYCVAWDVLDSQNFGLAQRRKRIFIVSSFGNISAAKVLFEQKGGGWDDTQIGEIRQRGLYLSTQNGERQDPTADTYVANVIQAGDYRKTQHGQYGNEGNLICSTIQATDKKFRKFGFGENLVSQTLGSSHRGNSSFVWQDTYIAETDANGKRKASGVSGGMDSLRGIVIGNAVSVNIAKWIGERILKYDSDFVKF